MLGGVFTVLSEVDEGSSGSGSCTAATVEAAHVPHVCSICMVASTEYGGKATNIAVLCELWEEVDHCSQFSPLRDVGCALPQL